MIIHYPNSKELVSKYNEIFVWYDNSEIDQEGDYKFCVQNFEGTDKRIYFSLIVASQSENQMKKLENHLLNKTQTYIEVYIDEFVFNL